MKSFATRFRSTRGSPFVAAILLLGALALPAALHGQTDFYNLDKDRPLRVEDAYTTKRWAFEVQAAPLALSQDRTGILRYSPSIELKHGFLPGLEGSVGLGIENRREGTDSTTKLGEVELSTLLNLWVEGTRLPAAGARVSGHLPTGSDDHAELELKGILTRTLRGATRAHLNGGLLAGSDRSEAWWAGVAVDHALPFRHTLLLFESWVSTPPAGDRRVHSTAGVRYQVSPTLVLDAGLGRSWAGEHREDWTLTLGVTHEFAVRALIPAGGGS